MTFFFFAFCFSSPADSKFCLIFTLSLLCLSPFSICYFMQILISRGLNPLFAAGAFIFPTSAYFLLKVFFYETFDQPLNYLLMNCFVICALLGSGKWNKIRRIIKILNNS